MPAPGPSNTVCLPLATAAKVRDSLTVLPLVRKEAYQQHVAAGRYKLAADAAFDSYLKQVSATGNVQLALREQKVETARQESDAKKWKRKAKSRSVWGWVKAIGGVALGVFIGAAAR